MSGVRATRESDERILRMLDLRDGELLTGLQIAERFRTSRSAVLAAMNRVDHAELPCACMKPENKDGGMARGWWK